MFPRLLIPALVLSSALGCGLFGDPVTPDSPRAARGERGKAPATSKEATPQARQAAAARALLDAKRSTMLAERLTLQDNPGRTTPLVDGTTLPADAPQLVAMVILDTLRADHTSLCGYEKPNTPVLEQLKGMGAATSCDAYSPATWTLPAHASYFTGATTAEHGVHTLGTPLSEDYETLAESYAARGYQTLFVSANPVFNKAAGGFWQGFDRVVVAKSLTGPLRADSFGRVMADELAKLDPNKPVFMVINIFDAHDPYPPVPEGLTWATAHPRENLQPHTADPTNPYHAFVTGNMPADKQAGYIDRIENSYDHAVFVADHNLGLLVRLLKRAKWLRKPHRVVVTSDHGEHLGEHGLMRHGSATWQTVTRVPFLVLDTTRDTPHDLPPHLNVTAVHHLLLHGSLPATPLLVESASAHNAEDFKPSWLTVSLWADRYDKVMQFDDKRWRYDLRVDPMETNPLPVPKDHPLIPALNERLAAHEASIAKALEAGQDPEVMEMLRSVGYVQ